MVNKKGIERMDKKYHFIIFFVLLISSVNCQNTIDLSDNKVDKTIEIKGTFLNIDTTGLSLKVAGNPRTFVNEKEQTVFVVEQKQLPLSNYESIIAKMLKFDTIIKENNIVIGDYKGKLIVGRSIIQNSNKYIWLCYIGNSELVIEIKGFYDESLHPKYEKTFDNVIKSMFINTKKEMSIYEDLPFYLDESKFPYKKEMSFMPQSITITRGGGEKKRMVSLSFFELNENEIEGLKEKYNKDHNIVYNGKEILSNVEKTDDRIKYEGIVIRGKEVVQFNCFSSSTDKTALDEFKEMIKSIEFRN